MREGIDGILGMLADLSDKHFRNGGIYEYAHGLYLRGQQPGQLTDGIRRDIAAAFGNADDKAAEIRLGFVDIFDIAGAAQAAELDSGHTAAPPLS